MYHFVLVHGACHGAWCWFKLTDRLQNAGHKVTAVDLVGCATRPQDPNSIATFSEYHQPLMDFLDSLPEAHHETPYAQKVSQISLIPIIYLYLPPQSITVMLVIGSEMNFVTVCFYGDVKQFDLTPLQVSNDRGDFWA